MKYDKKFYQKYGLKVTDEPLGRYKGTLNKETMERLGDEVNVRQSIMPKTIVELEGLIQEYPTVAAFKNYLYLAYAKSGQTRKAFDILNDTVRVHPNYIFGHLNLAGRYVSEGSFDKAAAVLKEPYHVRNLEKEDIIHEAALKGYYAMAITVELGRKNVKQAEALHRVLFDYNKDDDAIRGMGHKILAARIELNPIFSNMHNERAVEAISKPIQGNYLTLQNKPLFNHPEIQQLYKYSLEKIPKSVLQSILALPRPTLIQDLEHVLMDAILRYDHFQRLDWDEEGCNFFVHALFLLTELKAYSSLPVILDFLRQDDAFKEYWVSDWLDDYFSTPLYVLGENQLDVLKGFVLENNVSSWHRILACEVAAQVALKQPNRRTEVLRWFKEVIQVHLDNPKNNNLIDSDFLSFMLLEMTECAAVELTEDVKKLFAKGWIENSVCGGLDEVLAELNEPFNQHYSNPLPIDIYELYSGAYVKQHVGLDDDDIITDPYERYLQSLISESLSKHFGTDEDDDDDDYDDSDDDDDLDWTPQVPIKRIEPKVGRNEPCPCGSGKKYKKCHG